jgi:hypothetical protein
MYVLLLLVSRINFQYLTHAHHINTSAGKRIGYLNPILISEESHTFRIGKDNEELKGKTDE